MMLSDKSFSEVIIVDNFYHDPEKVRQYALKQSWYYPYQDYHAVSSGKEKPLWQSSFFQDVQYCPFKSSSVLIERLEHFTREKIDKTHWNLSFPLDSKQNPLPGFLTTEKSCRWNCSFHVKFNPTPTGHGVHNHVTDIWNAVGVFGWAGIIYLTPGAPRDSGLKTWRNKHGKSFEWMTGKDRWELMDDLANVYNRLILCRGGIPHSGGSGFSDLAEQGRLFQTFFFKTCSPDLMSPVSLAL